ncbi:hypothetical protein Tco_0433303 [Tanacetum coccineum]
MVSLRSQTLLSTTSHHRLLYLLSLGLLLLGPEAVPACTTLSNRCGDSCNTYSEQAVVGMVDAAVLVGGILNLNHNTRGISNERNPGERYNSIES